MRSLTLILGLLLSAGSLPAMPLWLAASVRKAEAPVGSAYVAEVLADAPLAYWRLNDTAPSGAGSVLDFSSGGTYDATPVGGLTWASAGSLADGLGKSALFNGTTGYLTGGATLANTLMLSSSWSIELWYYAAIANGGNIFGAAADATHRVRINHYGNKITTASSTGGNKSQLVNGTGNWHHLVLTSAGDLYIDGIAQTGTGGDSLNSTNQLTVGCLNNASTFFNGRIAEVSMYQTALSSVRVFAHYNAAIMHTLPTGQTFGMSMSTPTPELFPAGGDDTGTLYLGAAFVDDGGSNVLEVGGGTFRSITFDNPLLVDQWCSKNAGTFRLQFKYTGTLGQFMLGQIGGKDLSLREDTNDAVQLRVSPTGAEARFIHQGGSRIITTTQTLVADTWYDAEVKWNTTTSPYMTVTINGVSATSTVAGEVGNWLCTTPHLTLIGNDTPTTPTSLKIRNVRIYGSQQ